MSVDADFFAIQVRAKAALAVLERSPSPTAIRRALEHLAAIDGIASAQVKTADEAFRKTMSGAKR